MMSKNNRLMYNLKLRVSGKEIQYLLLAIAHGSTMRDAGVRKLYEKVKKAADDYDVSRPLPLSDLSKGRPGGY